MNTNDREQQPAGDGGRHVEVLRHLRELQPPNPEEHAALDAAIAAITAAGRAAGVCGGVAMTRHDCRPPARVFDLLTDLLAEMRRGGGTETGWIAIGTVRAWADRLEASGIEAMARDAAYWLAWCDEAEKHGADLAPLLDDAKHMGTGVFELHLRDAMKEAGRD